MLLAGAAGAVFAGAPYAAHWSPLPALPAAVVPAPPAALPGEGAPPSPPQPVAVAPPAPAAPAPREETPPGPPAAASQGLPARAWNTTDLDVATNGNLDLAAGLVAAGGGPPADGAPPGAEGRAPWSYVGEVQEFTGTVERSREYAPGAPPAPWPTARRPLGEVVLSGSTESGLMPVVCLTVGSPGEVQQGDRVRARGFVVGLAGTPNQDGGSTTGVVLVGEIARLPAA